MPGPVSEAAKVPDLRCSIRGCRLDADYFNWKDTDLQLCENHKKEIEKLLKLIHLSKEQMYEILLLINEKLAGFYLPNGRVQTLKSLKELLSLKMQQNTQ